MTSRALVFKKLPSNQIDGYSWIIDVIDDLTNFCMFNHLEHSAELFKKVRKDVSLEIRAKAL